jgi:hypothetical protein
MNDAAPPADAKSPRMEEFEAEVSALHIRGGAARPEGQLLIAGIVAAAAGIGLIAIGWYQASGTARLDEQNAYFFSCGLSGLALVILGGLVFLRFSLAKYLRYWLIREIYESREQTDRTIAALERIESAIAAQSESVRQTT